MKTRLDPSQTPEESAAIDRIAAAADKLTFRQRDKPIAEIIALMGNDIALELRKAAQIAQLIQETELQRLKKIEAVALKIAVKESCGEEPEEILAEVPALREAIGEDVVEAAVDALTAGFEEPLSTKDSR